MLRADSSPVTADIHPAIVVVVVVAVVVAVAVVVVAVVVVNVFKRVILMSSQG